MKKVLCIIILTLVLSGCDKTIKDIESYDWSETEIVKSEKYNVFKTRDCKKYLEFLDDLDKKYEIIDISTGMETYTKGESYVVIYKEDGK